MFSQHAKWLKVCNQLPWRSDIASLNYVLANYYLRYFCFICVIKAVIKGDLYVSVCLCHYRPQTNKILLWI